MANARGKEVDTTSLSIDLAAERGFIHRDYLAHCLRWSHVVSWLHKGQRYKTQHLLDVGCGKEAPLPKLLFSSRLTHTTGSYTGVDYGKLTRPATLPPEGAKNFKATFLEKFDFAKDALPRKKYDVLVCFEVLEHVEPWHAYQLLKRMRQVGDKIFISTPCYDAKTGAADNHVNEMTYAGLNALIMMAGLEVTAVYGTFASQKDYKSIMDEHQQAVFDQLSDYYDSNVLSCLMAPMFPRHARNCLWELQAGKVLSHPLSEISKPQNSNSSRWPTDLKKIHQDSLKTK